MPTVAAAFTDVATARGAVDQLLASGISADDISLVVSNSSRERFFPDHDGGLGAATSRGGAAGAVLGGIAGELAIGGALTAVTSGLAAPFLVAGPLVAALTGATSGAAVGAIAGGLVGAGVSKPVAEDLDHGVREGALLVAVRTTDADAQRIEDMLRADRSTKVLPPTDGPIGPDQA